MTADEYFSFPHTRGDVPGSLVELGGRWRFSPHAWGCSAYRREDGEPRRVFPTRVGMFPWSLARVRERRRFPHTRGDVPYAITSSPGGIRFSPHAWGCSAMPEQGMRSVDVFPTRVGMFRPCRRRPRHQTSFPHTRGDVPRFVCGTVAAVAFSPHAWGCSERGLTSGRRERVFPTRVGMFRRHGFPCHCWISFPHTRGDVPDNALVVFNPWMFSPHAWGCSVRNT